MWKVLLALGVLGFVASEAQQSNDVPAEREAPHQGKKLTIAEREAIFKNREQLLKYLSDPKMRVLLCKPDPNDSYDLFQEAIREKLDTLWDLDIYAAKYGLSATQRKNARRCAAQMEEYSDNFAKWQQLNSSQ